MKKTPGSKPPRRALLWLYVASIGLYHLWSLYCTFLGRKAQLKLSPEEVKQATAPENPDLPFVSIILPARDEERNVPMCVPSLLEQDYPHFELIVVNDDSKDQTGALLEQLQREHPQGHRLKIVNNHSLPTDWAGKPHALYCGIQQAKGDWFLFTDADTCHQADALSQSLAFARREDIDLLSLAPRQEMPGFWEKTMMPALYNGILLLYPLRFVNEPWSKLALANGQYILINRRTYTAIGGYESPRLRKTLLDDRDLAQVVKDAGYQLRAVDGQNFVSCCMYRGFGEIWRGWRKNIFLGNHGILSVVLQLVGMPLVTMLPILLPFSRKFFRTSEREIKLASLAAFLPWILLRVRTHLFLKLQWRYILTGPLAYGVLEGILASSTWRILTRKGVDWRGRNYFDQNAIKQAVPEPVKER